MSGTDKVVRESREMLGTKPSGIKIKSGKNEELWEQNNPYFY